MSDTGKTCTAKPNDEPASVLLDKIRQEKERLIKRRKSSVTRTHPLSYRGEDNSY